MQMLANPHLLLAQSNQKFEGLLLGALPTLYSEVPFSFNHVNASSCMTRLVGIGSRVIFICFLSTYFLEELRIISITFACSDSFKPVEQGSVTIRLQISELTGCAVAGEFLNMGCR